MVVVPECLGSAPKNTWPVSAHFLHPRNFLNYATIWLSDLIEVHGKEPGGMSLC
jgi:hypothetical protein